ERWHRLAFSEADTDFLRMCRRLEGELLPLLPNLRLR
ncbi:hypothetical protein LCGC14_2424700, partial [marine sediment metagenome]